MEFQLKTSAPPVEEVDELFENQRCRPFEGWSSKFLLKSDPSRFSDHSGGRRRSRNDPPPSGWDWVPGEKWTLDTTYIPCDTKGWTYAKSFRDFTSTNLGLPASKDSGTRVRRRRFIRRRRPVASSGRVRMSIAGQALPEEGEEGEADTPFGGPTLVGRHSEQRDGQMNIEVVIHGEAHLIHANSNDTVTWLHSMAAAEFCKEHNFDTHTVEILELYTQDIFAEKPGSDRISSCGSLSPLDRGATIREGLTAAGWAPLPPRPAPAPAEAAGKAIKKAAAAVKVAVQGAVNAGRDGLFPLEASPGAAWGAE
ncbi:unnamed protein product, partial [Discosporangium mesarthrocarpum]